VRLNPHLDPLRATRTSQTNAAVNKSNKSLNPVQERLNFQLSGWLLIVFHTRFNPESANKGQPLFAFSGLGQIRAFGPRAKTSRVAAFEP
jgi:hypothetical protein